MKKTVFITGKDTPFGNALVAEARSRGYAVVATVEPDRSGAATGKARAVAETTGRKASRRAGKQEADAPLAAPGTQPAAGTATESDDLVVVPWNRASAFSARNLILQCRNINRPLDAALLVCTPRPETDILANIEPAVLDRFVDEEIKGRVFLARELAAEFSRQGSGILSLVAYQNGTPLGALDSLAMGAFHAFAQELFVSQAEAPWLTQGYSCAAQLDADFAAFIFKGMEEATKRNSGHWSKFTGKQGFLTSVFRQ